LISAWQSNENQISAEISNWANAAVIGPGLGNADSTRSLVEQLVGNSKIPILLDADALNVFEGDSKSLATLLAGRPALITPHVAEFARLTGVDVTTVLTNRFDVGLHLARQLVSTVLLKGSPTAICTPGGARHGVP